MKKIFSWKTFQDNPVKLALTVLLILQFCLIVYSNLTLIDENLDCDNAKLFVHTAEIWNTKTLVLPDWNYLTTLEWDCSSVLAIPFYALTHNITLSFGLSNVLFLCGFLGLIFLLFKGEDSLYPLLAANLLIIPYQTGMLDYYNMMLFAGGQYIIKATIPIFLIGIILCIERTINRKNRPAAYIIVLMAVYLALFFLSSASSGVYVTVCGVFPVFAVYLCYKFFRWEKVPFLVWVLIICSMTLSLLGVRINALLMADAARDNMAFCTASELRESSSACFFGMFELFGGATAASEILILSFEGIGVLAKCCFVILMLVSGIISIVKLIKKESNLKVLLLLSIFLWNLFVLIVSYPRGGSETYEYRYHLIGMVPLVLVTCVFLIDSIKKLQMKQRNCLYWAGVLAVFFLCVFSYPDVYTSEDPNANLKELCTYVRGMGLELDYVYILDNSAEAEICRAIDDSVTYLYLLGGGNTQVFDYYNYYHNVPMQIENAIVVVNNNQYDLGETFEIAGKVLIKFDSVADRNLYYFAGAVAP